MSVIGLSAKDCLDAMVRVTALSGADLSPYSTGDLSQARLRATRPR